MSEDVCLERPPDVQVTCLTTGLVRAKEPHRGLSRYFRNRWSDETLPVHVYLVRHPEGLLLFDVGQTARATAAGYHPWWHPFLRLSRFELTEDEEVAQQLQTRGMSASDIRWVFLSHLHTDHVGDIESFAGSDVLVSRREWERSTGLRGSLRGYVPQHWPIEIVPRLLDFTGPPVGPFPGSESITRDGALVALAAPGHTPGHAALLVRGRRPLLLGGDLAHDRAALAELAPSVERWCAAHSIAFLATHDPDAPRLLREAGG